MNQTTRSQYHAHNSISLMNFWHIQGLVIDEDDKFTAYISSLEDDVKLRMGNIPFVQDQQKTFWNAVTKYVMRHCNIFS